MKATCRKSRARNLKMCSDLTLGLFFKVKPKIATFKSAYNFIIGPRGLQCETKL